MENKAKNKKPYTKPTVKTIELETSEVLAVGCKIAGSSAANGRHPPCWSSGCQNRGS